MSENSYLFYSDYLKRRKIKNKSILIAKTNNSYLIGPKIDSEFYEQSFYKRIKSNWICVNFLDTFFRTILFDRI